MRTKKVTRYYCDHCSKGSLTRNSMADHEKRCFRNPSRICGICHFLVNVPEMVAILVEGADGLKKLRDAADNCPGCILAAIIQSRKNGKPDNDSEWYDFDYKKEKDAWIDAENREFRDAVFTPLP